MIRRSDAQGPRDSSADLGDSSQAIELTQPAGHSVPTRAVLGHHPFIFIPDRPQVAEGRCGYAGSNKPFPSNAIPSGKNSYWNPGVTVDPWRRVNIRSSVATIDPCA